jgi:hypothetical protein
VKVFFRLFKKKIFENFSYSGTKVGLLGLLGTSNQKLGHFICLLVQLKHVVLNSTKIFCF